LPFFGDNGLMVIGAILIASQIVIIGPRPALATAVLQFHADGFGFYMLHGGFQVFTSEIAPDARASAVSLQPSCSTAGNSPGRCFMAWAC